MFPEGGDEGFAALAALSYYAAISLFSHYERGTSTAHQRSSVGAACNNHEIMETAMGRGLLLWLIGIPIPIILLIWLFGGLHG